MEIYKKVNRRYIPVGLCSVEQQYLPIGAHLVIVSPSCTSTKHNINVSEAVVLAAVQNVRKALVDALDKATELQPDKRTVTPLEAQAWKAYVDIAGNPTGLRFEGISMNDVVDKALEVLKKELKERSVSCGKIQGF